MGGLNAFPRNFSLSDLTVDLQQSCEDEQTLSFLGSFPSKRVTMREFWTCERAKAFEAMFLRVRYLYE